VFAGEMTAIDLAMQTVKQLDKDRPIASSVHENSTSRPKMLQVIYDRKLNRKMMCWTEETKWLPDWQTMAPTNRELTQTSA